MKRIRSMLIKEFIQIRRDRRMFGLLIIAPLLQLFIIGSAANTDVRMINLAIRDNDHSYQSREFVRALTASDYFNVTVLSGPAGNDGDLLVDGKAGLVLSIPGGFGKALINREAVSVQALVDGADSNFATHGLSFLNAAARLYSERLVRVAATDLSRATGLRLPDIKTETRIWFNPDLRSTYHMIPAIIGVLLLVTTMIVSSMAIVKEREEGTMEQIIVTPLRSRELIAGKLLPFVLIGLIEVTLAVACAVLVFRVPLHGSIFLLYGVSCVFLLTTLGLGLFISTLVRTQQQAMMLSAFFVMLPFILLSGFIFPVQNMPRPIQYVAAAIPLKYFLTSVRAIFLKGATLVDIWDQIVILFVWGIGILTLADLKFRKKLD